MPKTQVPTTAKVSTKQKIVQGALSVFAASGYTETTMDAIAAAAQVAKGTLYYHFKTKEELYMHVLEQGVARLQQAIQDALDAGERTPEERTLSILDEHLRFFAENGALSRLMLSFNTGEHQLDELLKHLMAGYFATMERLLADFQRQGVIDAGLDISTVASGLFGMIEVVALRAHVRGEPVYSSATRATLIAMGGGALGFAVRRATP